MRTALATRPERGVIRLDLGVRWALPPRLLRGALVAPAVAAAAAVAAGASWMIAANAAMLAGTAACVVWAVSLSRQNKAVAEVTAVTDAAEVAFGHETTHWLVDALPARTSEPNHRRWVLRQWEHTLTNLSGRTACTDGHEPGCAHHPIEFRRPSAGPLVELYRRLEARPELPGVWLR